MNRLTLKDPPGDEPNIVFRYDVAGRLVEVNDGRDVIEGGGVTKYKYDRIGRVSEVNDIYGKTVKYQYDKRGLRTKMIYPDDSNATYEYDALARVTTVKYNGTIVAKYTYDELGRRTQVNYGNGAKIDYQYDIGNRLQRITNIIDGNTIFDFNYSNYDKVGNRLSMKLNDANAQIYEYDSIYQLNWVDYNDGNGTLYDYDSLGNRAGVYNGEAITYATNALNQYTRVNDANFRYDKNGNLKNDKGYPESYDYIYDYENRLISAAWPSTHQYKYDFSGRRVKNQYFNGAIATKYVYDGDQIIADYNAAGVIQRKYVYGPGIDEPICMVSVKNNNAVYYYHYDGLGSVVALSSVEPNQFSSIAAGEYHSLAIKDDGSVVAWGSNYWGQATAPEGNDFVAVAAGWDYSIALKTNGTIIYWGSSDYEQSTPPEGNDFVAISAGGGFSLALKQDGSIVGWGENWAGQATPPAGNDYIAIAAGGIHSIALRSNGSIVCWGYNEQGQATPPSGYDFVAISAGAFHSIALKSDGSIIGWGWDYFDEQATPPAGNDFVSIAAGGFHSLALKSNGTIVGWGWDSMGQATPPEGNDFNAIAAGVYHSVARKSDGSVICWGGNERSQAAAPLTAIVETYTYDVFGNTKIFGPGGITRTSSAVGNRFMFTGREYDYETGNYYYRARYYSPRIGRFLQTDPINYVGGINLYSYCYNDPINFIDPYGLDAYVIFDPEGGPGICAGSEELGHVDIGVDVPDYFGGGVLVGSASWGRVNKPITFPTLDEATSNKIYVRIKNHKNDVFYSTDRIIEAYIYLQLEEGHYYIYCSPYVADVLRMAGIDVGYGLTPQKLMKRLKKLSEKNPNIIMPKSNESKSNDPKSCE